MKFTAKQFLLLLPVFVLSAGLLTFGQGRAPAAPELAVGRWKLIEANGNAVTNSEAFIDFRKGLGELTGSTGCNTMNGRVSVRGTFVDISAVATTKRMCKLMEGNVAESEFLRALAAAVRFNSNGKILHLFDREGRGILRFRRDDKDADPDAGPVSMTAAKWVLESIKGRQTFVALPYAFIRFDERRRSVGGDTSCNSFDGSYRTFGRDSIALTNVIMTMRACVESSKMSVQREMLDGLRVSNRYEIRDGRLNLYRGNRLELTFRPDGK
jgi:heat shock protein HslJ